MLLSNTVFFHTKFHTNTYQISTTATTVTAIGHLSKEIEQPIRTRFDNFQLSRRLETKSKLKNIKALLIIYKSDVPTVKIILN